MLRGCEMNNYSLCIKYSLFHQPQSPQLCIFSLVCCWWKCLGVTATVHLLIVSNSSHIPEPGKEADAYCGCLCNTGHTHALTHFLLWTFQHMCSLQTLGHLMKRIGTLRPGLPFSDSFLTLSETYCFSPVGLWWSISQVSHRKKDYLKYEPVHD